MKLENVRLNERIATLESALKSQPAVNPSTQLVDRKVFESLRSMSANNEDMELRLVDAERVSQTLKQQLTVKEQKVEELNRKCKFLTTALNRSDEEAKARSRDIEQLKNAKQELSVEREKWSSFDGRNKDLIVENGKWRDLALNRPNIDDLSLTIGDKAIFELVQPAPNWPLVTNNEYPQFTTVNTPHFRAFHSNVDCSDKYYLSRASIKAIYDWCQSEGHDHALQGNEWPRLVVGVVISHGDPMPAIRDLGARARTFDISIVACYEQFKQDHGEELKVDGEAIITIPLTASRAQPSSSSIPISPASNSGPLSLNKSLNTSLRDIIMERNLLSSP